MTNSFKLSTMQAGSKRDYWRDSRDRITAWKKNETGRGDRYRYDAEGQLTNASYQALTPETTPTGALRNDIFTYDALGNRQGWNYLASRGWMNFTRRDNRLNQYWSWENNIPAGTSGHWGSAIYHDDNSPWAPWNVFPGNGVTMADGWLVASYNALNQPMAMIPYGSPNVFYFGYDPLGRCVKRWEGSSGMAGSNPATYLYYDGWSLVQEGSSAANAGRLYVHGNRVDEIVASQTGGVWNYHHYDARGHCILLTGPSGNVIEQYEYDAFGKPYFYNAIGVALPYSSSYGNRFLFTGREWLRDLKLYDYRARMYQPELGRFLQPDPKQFEAGDYNLYRFCHNDPVNKSDPTGFVWVIPGKLREDFDTARAAAWNPRAAVAFAGGSQSPATVLIHEAAHADRIALDPQGSKNAFAAGDGPMGRAGVFGNMEDRRVILGPEAQAAKALGEDTRSSAAGVFYPVDSVLGR